MNSLVKPLTLILGIVLTLIGLAGFFVSGELLVFEVDSVHNLIHLASGIVALLIVKYAAFARLYLIVFGFVYGAVALVGFVTGDILGLFSVNDADNYLHTAIAVVCLAVGLGSGRKA